MDQERKKLNARSLLQGYYVLRTDALLRFNNIPKAVNAVRPVIGSGGHTLVRTGGTELAVHHGD